MRVIVPLTVALMAVALLLAAACGASDDPPPLRPFEDSFPPGPAATTPGVTPDGTADVTPDATPGATADPPPATLPDVTPAAPADPGTFDDREVVVGLVIEMVAEWLGVPAIDLTVSGAREVVWPDACMGVSRPGVACAQVETPGFEVQLLDAFGGLHSVHMATRGNALWRGGERVRGTVRAIDVANGIVTIEVEDGERALRTVPGTSWPVERSAGLSGLSVGDAVVVATDPAPDGAQPPVIAWLVLAP